MSQLIKILAEKAGYDVVYYEPDHHNPNGAYLGEGFDFNQLAKFAELIVAECADVALKSGKVRNKNALAVAEADRIYDKINQHFSNPTIDK